VAVARQELDDEFDEDEFVDEFGGDEPSQPWHNSTRAVVGASAAGLAVIGVLVASVMFVTGRSEPGAPADFTDPSFTATASEVPTTTTATITSTAPVSTTEINAPTGPPTTSGSSATSSGVSSEPSTPPTFRPRQREGEESPGGPTSRRPRFNITRTLPPQQPG
jgi:hypothetical protein